MTNIVLMVELTKNSGILVILAIGAVIGLSVFMAKNKDGETPVIDPPQYRPIHVAASNHIDQIESCLTYEQLLAVEERFKADLDYYAGHKHYKVFYSEIDKVIQQKRFQFTN